VSGPGTIVHDPQGQTLCANSLTLSFVRVTRCVSVGRQNCSSAERSYCVGGKCANSRLDVYAMYI
jgi:hypothetical protein